MIGADLLSALGGSTIVDALGWTLVHLLWQGLALGLLFAVANRAARDGSALTRYWLGMGVLAAMFVTEEVANACSKVTGSRLCRSREGDRELSVVVVHNPQ